MLLLLMAALYAHASDAAPRAANAAAVFYVVSEPTAVRADPDAKSHSVARLKPFDLASGCEVVDGWLRIDASSGRWDGGWIEISRDNVVDASMETLRLRIFRVQQTKWPDRTKLDVVRGRIRERFTADQVRLALGDPVRKELRRAGDDVSEAWTYPDRIVLFSHSGVTSVEIVDDAPLPAPPYRER